ncbi:division/cell wall cluster transcriptional repressor MraZ [Ureaplasma ceti]|uniref:Transcriptional regulator MraZ n=1 Tax=Ureaplasma ceti TaxID=3119530 RepID=A0ABP9U5V2_9BACT
MLLGTYEHSLDSKKRLTLPASIRRKLDAVVMISASPDKCIELRTPEEFQKYADALNQNGSNKAKLRALQRAILGNTFEVQIDSANRILLPSVLIKVCSINKNVVLIGVGNKVEIWDADIYNEEKRVDDINSLSSIFEEMDDDNDE